MLGQPEPSGDPVARIEDTLDEMVLKAKEEAEMALMEEDPMAEPEKSMILMVDVSGSMGSSTASGETRMQAATRNMLKVFDDYVNDGDSVSFIAFSHKVNVVFPITVIQGHNRAKLREKAQKACTAGGGTAMYDALIEASKLMKKADQESPRWMICLTDGADQHSKTNLGNAHAQLKLEGDSGVDMVIVGIELTPQVIAPCERLATMSDKSLFINAAKDMNALDEAFEAVAELICD